MSDEHKWYILQAYAGYEQKVKSLIEKQLRFRKMEELVEEIFIPSEEVTTKKKGKTRTSQVTYFPGYILVKMKLTDDLWHVLHDIPRVSGFVGGDQKNPLPVPEKELADIRQQIESGIKQAEIDASFTTGQTVVVIEGPFKDFNGVIDAVDREHAKLSVLVSIFGRATPLELDFDKVRLAT
ncbi:MAG: transcription termination/antitermination protein NusG [Proteobacteria bacterium]|nr:transcription termination/antitermination protein NusG [Pseudomonadota bacterium]